jgi:hypothetical protein
MKKILQAAAIMVMTASVVFAAALSSHKVREGCTREWSKSFQQLETGLQAGGKNSLLLKDIFLRHIN